MRLLYVHLPRFPIQRRVLQSPALRNAALVLAEERQGVRRVAFASGEALRARIEPGLTLTAARALSPGLTVLEHESALDERALLSAAESLLTFTPAFQLAPPEGFWMDAGAAHLVGGEGPFSERVRARLRQQGLEAHLACADDLFTSRCLARHGRKSVQVVPFGRAESRRALAGLPLEALEEEEAVALGKALGLSTLGELAALSAGSLAARLGRAGLEAHRRACGGDERRFTATAPAQVLEEAAELDFPAESLEPLLFVLKAMLDRLSARLAGRRLAAVRARVELKLDPHGRAELPLLLARPTRSPKALLDLLRLQLEAVRLENPIASVTVRVEEATLAHEQQLLLGEEPQGDAPLESVLSRLASALGDEALGALTLVDSHRPEAAQRACAFRPPRAKGWGAGPAPSPVQETLAQTCRERPVRLLPRPLPLRAELGRAGELLAVQLEGRRHAVLALTGPERLGGEWWSADPYQRDYFRVFVEDVGPVWLFRELNSGRYFLHGMFD